MLVMTGILLFLVLMLLAIRIALSKTNPVEEDIQNPLIHASGVYSILRQSPRDIISKFKPTEEEIRKYCAYINENMKNKVEKIDSNELLEQWNASINQNVDLIEVGDNQGIEFYYYDFQPEDCAICTKYLKKGQFVTRGEINKYPSIIPPFHLGCTCRLCAHHGKEDLRDTTELGMSPLFKKEIPPKLPDWKALPKQQTIRGSL